MSYYRCHHTTTSIRFWTLLGSGLLGSGHYRQPRFSHLVRGYLSEGRIKQENFRLGHVRYSLKYSHTFRN